MRGNTFRPFGGDSIAVMSGENDRHDAIFFADDVIVDFPCVAPAVDRIRLAFLADERSAPLSTAIKSMRFPGCALASESGAGVSRHCTNRLYI